MSWVIYLRAGDLPADLHGEPLLEYAQSLHPDRRVVLEGYLEVFNLLPSELLRKILRERRDIWLLSSRISKGIQACVESEFYSSMRDTPVSMKEIERLCSSNGGEVTMFHHHLILKGSLVCYCVSSRERNQGEFLLECEQGANVSFTHRVSLLSGVPDLFSEHRILHRRGNLIGYYPKYAIEKLVERYNLEVAPDLPEQMSFEDIARVHKLGRTEPSLKSWNFEGYRLNNWAHVGAIGTSFKSLRAGIREKVVAMTGATSGDGHALVLR